VGWGEKVIIVRRILEEWTRTRIRSSSIEKRTSGGGGGELKKLDLPQRSEGVEKRIERLDGRNTWGDSKELLGREK